MTSDFLQSFLFDNSDIRGSLVKLDTSFAEMVSEQDYHPAQKQLLAQFIAAILLMSSHLKFEGLLSLQARGENQVSLVMAECTDQLNFRGIIRGDGNFDPKDFLSLFENGALAITVEPEKGQRYQGIVPFEGSSLSDCLSAYFKQSEQIPTWFYFAQQGNQVAALMLQALPSQQANKEQALEDWQRITHLASTLSDNEMLNLDAEQILYRLYHEEVLRLFDPRPVAFSCSCSRERMERALINLPNDELQELSQSTDDIETQCHFCNHRYRFSPNDVALLLQSKGLH